MGRLSRWEGRLFGIFVRGKAAAGQIVRRTISADSARRPAEGGRSAAGSRGLQGVGRPAGPAPRSGAVGGGLRPPPKTARRAVCPAGRFRFRHRCVKETAGKPTARAGQTISSSMASMRRRRLYLAVRSLRQGAPVLIWPQAVATARSAMVVSSVSPLRWLRMAP